MFSVGKKKAPGYDEVTAVVIIKIRLLDIMNWALTKGKFPVPWKIGVVKYLYKGEGKDPKLSSACKPIYCYQFWARQTIR